jgi:hypothetical protein
MSDFFKRDPRIEDGTPLRDLEKKVHYLIHMCALAGVAVDKTGNPITSPDDFDNWDVFIDSSDVQSSQSPKS